MAIRLKKTVKGWEQRPVGVSKEIRRLLLMSTSSNIIFNFIGIFVNLYIWEKGRSVFDVTWFNLIMFSFWIASYALGAKLLTAFSSRLLVRAIAICGAVTFLLLSFVHLENRLLWITMISIPVAFMWALYSVTQNILLCVFAKGQDFVSFFSLQNLINQLVSVLNPIVFALVINLFGYSGSFMLMFVFISILLAVSFFIPAISLPNESEPLFSRIGFRGVFSSPSLRWIAASSFAAGILLQFQGLFALLFTFSVSENKLVIALLNVLYASSAIMAMAVYKKLKRSQTFFLASGIALICCGFLITLYPKAPMLIVSNVLTTIGMFYFSTIWNTQQFRIITTYKPLEQARLLIWREWLLCFSRIFMLLFILRIKDFHGVSFIVLMVFTLCSSLAIPFFVHHGAKQQEATNSM